MKLTTQFNLRMSPEEFKAIRAMAASSGISMNAFIIAKCLDVPAKPDKAIKEPTSGAKAQERQSTAKIEQAPVWSGGYGKDKQIKIRH